MVEAHPGLDSQRNEPLPPEAAAEELAESTAEAPEEAEADPPCGRRLALVGEASLEAAGEVLRRVSFETSLDSKQPKLEPKLVSALSETKRLFRLFRFYTETESFDVSIEPKQTEDPPKQFKWEYIWLFFKKNRVFSVCYETVLFVSVVSI